MAMAWEKKFLDFVEHYESDNLNIYYNAEVCLAYVAFYVSKSIICPSKVAFIQGDISFLHHFVEIHTR